MKNIDERIKEFFKEDNYKLGQFEKSRAGVLVYRK